MQGSIHQAEDLETLARLMIRAYCVAEHPATKDDLAQLRLDLRHVACLSDPRLTDFLTLANTHHVIVRAMSVLQSAATLEREDRIAAWCAESLAAERERVARAVSTLHGICSVLESRGCKVVVIKSLDHWPDLGSDLDLYTTADGQSVEQSMREEFGARPVERSWGDRLASKWNYAVPGLPELVEVHVRYLGQTGEHAVLAQRVMDRRVRRSLGEHGFHVPAAEERIIIAALQRMYRHFYFRLCDMIDLALLLQTGAVHYGELRQAAQNAGIWSGVATFLCLAQEYIRSRGGRLCLPAEIAESAYPTPGVVFHQHFLRVSKATAARLFCSQLFGASLRHDVRALLRLPLLPPLAVSALVAHSLTGNDKGIW